MSISVEPNVNKKPNQTFLFYSHRSATVLNPTFHLNHNKWIFSNRILNLNRITAHGQRSICVSSFLHEKKKHVNPEEQVIVHKTNQRSTNKKTLNERKIKQKRTVWGIIDVYRFITVEKLASLMDKNIGEYESKVILELFVSVFFFF